MSKLIITKDNILDLCDKFIFIISKKEYGVPYNKIYAINKYGILCNDYRVCYYWKHIKSDIENNKFDYFICDDWANGYASRKYLEEHGQLIVDVQID